MAAKSLDSQGQITPIPTSDVNCTVLGDEVGIAGTPVIDASSETVYLVAATKDTQSGQGVYQQKMYALNLTNGKIPCPPRSSPLLWAAMAALFLIPC